MFFILRATLPNIVEDPRYEGLDQVDRAKVGGNVSSNDCINHLFIQITYLLLYSGFPSNKTSVNIFLKYPRLQQDVAKPSLRKDWNCPWVKRDGKGLKRVVRGEYGGDPTPAPIKTSHHHFYRYVSNLSMHCRY